MLCNLDGNYPLINCPFLASLKLYDHSWRFELKHKVYKANVIFLCIFAVLARVWVLGYLLNGRCGT